MGNMVQGTSLAHLAAATTGIVGVAGRAKSEGRKKAEIRSSNSEGGQVRLPVKGSHFGLRTSAFGVWTLLSAGAGGLGDAVAAAGRETAGAEAAAQVGSGEGNTDQALRQDEHLLDRLAFQKGLHFLPAFGDRFQLGLRAARRRFDDVRTAGIMPA